MSEPKTWCDGFGSGIAVMIAALIIAAGCLVIFLTSLDSARANYRRCVADGAPKQACADRYLLPHPVKDAAP